MKNLFFSFILLWSVDLFSGEAIKSPDIYKCTGKYWIYFYEFQETSLGEACSTNSIRKTDQKKGHKGTSDREKAELTQCWRSMAKIQMDGAKCCLINKNGRYYEPGLPVCGDREVLFLQMDSSLKALGADESDDESDTG